MSKIATRLPKTMPRTFRELNAILPLRPICDQVDLDNAYEVVNRLAVINKPTKDQRDYLDSLVILTEAFDKEENDAALAEAEKISGLQLLKYLLQNTGTTQTKLAGILGIGVSAASMIAKGERSITVEHARALGKHFKLDPGAFFR